MRNRRTAFTLVELLVVIGIIALLISVLLPSLAKARQAANTAACLSQLRQLGQAVVMYCNDYNAYPHADQPYGFAATDPRFPSNDSNEWVRILPTYWRKPWNSQDRFTEPMFRCPQQDPKGLTGDSNLLHYGMSSYFDPGHVGLPSHDCVRPTKVRRAAEIILIADKNGPSSLDAAGFKGPNGPLVRNSTSVATQESRWPAIRHNNDKLTCIAFADGHAEAIAFGDYATARSWDWRLK